MKKEYLILVAVIIGLGAYLALKKDNQVHYQLPALAQVDTAQVDTVDIIKGKTTLTLSKGEKGWTVSDKAYPAAQAAVDSILDTVKGLTLSALASETGDRVRYELDEENAIQVKASIKGKVVREFTIGKTAPSFNHTFVMLKGDQRVFQADKNFRGDFDKTQDELRDKVVLSFKSDAIKKIVVEKDGMTQTLALADVQAASDEKAGEDKKEAKPQTRWMTGDAKPADQTVVQDLIASLSHLECQAFKDDAQTAALGKTSPTCKISLENETVFRLNLFAQKQGDDVAGTSSQVPFAFDLASYKAGDIVSYVNQLLGIKEEKPSEKN